MGMANFASSAPMNMSDNGSHKATFRERGSSGAGGGDTNRLVGDTPDDRAASISRALATEGKPQAEHDEALASLVPPQTWHFQG